MRAIAIFTEQLTDAQISYISTNETEFVEGESVKFEKSNVQAIVNTIDVSSQARLVGGLVLGTETVTDAGDASTHVPVTLVVNTSGAVVVGLANGTEAGQHKTFIHTDASGTKSTVTPATTCGGYASAELAAVGDTLSLVWTGACWAIVGRQSGATNAIGAFDGPAII